MEENKNFDCMPEQEVEQVDSPCNWFADDFEESFRRAVPRHRSLAPYKPKPKRMRRLFRNPVFAAVISSLITCCICLGVFSAAYRPNVTVGSVLPQPGEAVRARGYDGDVVQIATGTAEGTLSIPDVYDLASPTVVSILCKSQGGGYVQSKMSSGSGIIIRHDGYVVTNNHVIDGASEISDGWLHQRHQPFYGDRRQADDHAANRCRHQPR